MPRRFYIRPSASPAPSTAARQHAYPRWFIPALVFVGASLGLIAYRVTCAPGRESEVAVEEPAGRDAMQPRANPIPSQPAEAQRTPAAVTDGRRRSFEGLRVQVLNGCGVKGVAKVITPGLRAYGFDVRETRNAAHFSYETSIIIDRTGNLGLARVIADSLGVRAENVSSEPAPNLVDIDLTLIVGADYRRLHLNSGSSNRE